MDLKHVKIECNNARAFVYIDKFYELFAQSSYINIINDKGGT